MSKKRAPTDSTLRNVRAANTRLRDLEQRLKLVEQAILAITRIVPPKAGRGRAR